MKRFVLVTRGRTGSTAIIDELNNFPGLRVEQEIFTRMSVPLNPELLSPCFNRSLIESRSLKMMKFVLGEARAARLYLRSLEWDSMKVRATGFGFKALSNHFSERKYLLPLLKKRGYSVVYLIRNPVRTTISGLVANQRKQYSSQEPFLDSQCYYLDSVEFETLVHAEYRLMRDEYQELLNVGIPICRVTYEEFLMNRKQFFAAIADFLGLDFLMPARKSGYSIMIQNPQGTIKNFDSILSVVKKNRWTF